MRETPAFVRADPAGNITLLVTDPVAPEERSSVARELLARFGGEQVGFITPPRLGGVCRLEMMGGEFCGNALRSLGRWWLDAHPGETELSAEISGSDAPLRVEAIGELIRARLPLPLSVTEDAALFPGIVHRLRFGPVPGEGEARRLTAALCEEYHQPAAGLLTVSDDRRTMTPAVFVRDTDTLFFESSCASGSAAAAAILSRERPEGESVCTLRQPGGVLTARAIRRDGVLTGLSVEGTVTLRYGNEA